VIAHRTYKTFNSVASACHAALWSELLNARAAHAIVER